MSRPPYYVPSKHPAMPVLAIPHDGKVMVTIATAVNGMKLFREVPGLVPERFGRVSVEGRVSAALGVLQGMTAYDADMSCAGQLGDYYDAAGHPVLVPVKAEPEPAPQVAQPATVPADPIQAAINAMEETLSAGQGTLNLLQESATRSAIFALLTLQASYQNGV